MTTPSTHTQSAAPEDETPDNTGGLTVRAGSPTRDGFRLIARFVRMHPVPFAISLIGGVAWALLVVAATYVLGRITDEVIEPAFRTGVDSGAVWGAVLALVLVAVLRGLSVVVRRWYGSVTEARMQASLRRSVGERLLTMPMSSYRKRPTGELLANADVDVTNGTNVLMPLPFSIGVIALLVVSLVSLFSTDVMFAVVALVLFPTLAVLSRYYTNKVSGPSAVVQDQLGRVSAIAHESFDGALAVKTLGREEEEDERFDAASDQLRTDRLVVARMTAVYQPLIDLLPNLGMVALLVVGAWRIDTGATSAGQLVQAVALFGWLAFPMRIVGFLFESMPRSVVSVRRVDSLLAEPADTAAHGSASGDGYVHGGTGPALSDSDAPNPAPPARRTPAEVAADEQRRAATGSVPLPDGALSLEVRDLHFAYGPTEVLRGVSFDIDPGEVVALVGSTGSGKSTLVNLLLRLDDPSTGEILANGVPIDEVDPDELRAAVTLAFQEAFLFAETVDENVAMQREVTGNEVDAALDRARALRFVKRLPDELATVVGERGVTLSGGQRQRVALARALAGSPRLLVLDDATSAVDPVVEAEILSGLRSGDTTMLVVAHRLSTILLADRVVHLEDGQVRNQGTHEELLDDPEYAALVTAYETTEEFDRDAAFADDPDSVSNLGETGEGSLR